MSEKKTVKEGDENGKRQREEERGGEAVAAVVGFTGAAVFAT